MRVASYNIRKAVGLDWRRDPDRILGVLAEIDADIVVLQEADRRFGSRAGVLPLARLDRDFGYVRTDVSQRARSHGWHGNVILIRNRFDCVAARRITLPHLEPRGAVSVRIRDPHIEIIGVHLGLTPNMRRRQCAALCAITAHQNHPILLAGDFNERTDQNLNFPAPAKLITPGPSFHAKRPFVAFDRFVLTKGLRATASHVHRSALAARASDHLPIVIDLEIKDGGA